MRPLNVLGVLDLLIFHNCFYHMNPPTPSGTGLLIIPKVKTRTYSEASFQHYGPCLWNSLPEDLRAAESVDIFKNRLKTHLFNLAFNSCCIYCACFCLNVYVRVCAGVGAAFKHVKHFVLRF